MFKLESYITPLLLNYVDKYIKNLKPEDSQFSLWGGDAVFCNLDLRLDVLEQELQLPFTFINGHIHELRIHIPWTKLGSEPVVITINTIECILKLCTDNDGTTKKPNALRSLKKPDVVEAPPGYVQSLINRVISNICIICNNVILKYVEEDIVLSLNIKSVELFNANDKWEKAFVDTNIADTIFRKVIYMQDLTVCLDKRDASGKIETYQDPLLYRCSSTWRMYSVYNTPHSKYPALTRIHMYCESLDFSLTDQQLPMFLKLMYLCIALHNRSDVTGQGTAKSHEETVETKPSASDEETDETEVLSPDASWGSWAWSFVPEVGVIWGSSGSEEEQEQEANMLKSKKIFQFGVYIGKSTCILKQTTFSNDASFCISPKCVFVPLMITKMYGCSMEFTSKGKDFLNMQSGICGVTVTGLQDCVCGFPDCSDDSNPMHNVFLKSGVPPGSGHVYSFLSSSLFDPLAAENCNQERKYCLNWTEHFATLTEEVMVKRYPAFAFDYLYQLDIPEDWIDRISSVTSSFVEDSNWHESSTYRLVFGPLCVDVTSSLVHRLRKLLFCAQDYDYPYYAPSKKASTHPAHIDDEVLEEMEEFVPLRQYHLTLFKPVLRLSVADHTPYHSTKQEHRRAKKKRLKSPKYIKMPKNEAIFCLEAYADCVDFQTSTPMYPNRLVKVIGSLTNPSQFLLHHCYDSSSVKIFGLELSLHKNSLNLSPDSTIIQQTCLTFFKKNLVLPEVWSSSKNLTLQESTFECSSIHLKLSEIDILSFICVYQSWTAKYFNPSGLEKLKVALEESKHGSPVISTEVCGTNFLYLIRKDSTSVKFSVASASLKFQHEGNSSMLFYSPVSTAHLHKGILLNEIEHLKWNENDNKQMFLQLLLQKPTDINNQNPVLLVINVEGSTVCLEPAFFTWMSSAFFSHINLDSSEIEYASPSPVDMEGTSTSSSITQEASVSHSLTKSHSTIMVDEKSKSLHENIEDFLRKHWEVLSYLILEVEIGSLCGICPQHSWSIVPVETESVLYSWQQAVSKGSLNEACVFSLPIVKIRNNSSVSNFLQTIDVMEATLPIKVVLSEKKSAGYFPWSLQMNCGSVYTVEKSESSNYKFLLWPSTVSATIALSLKDNQNQLGLCIHMDNKSLSLNFSAFQANLLMNCFCNVSSVIAFIERLNVWISYFQLKFNDSPDYVGSVDLNVQEQILDQSKEPDVTSHDKKASHGEPNLDLSDEQKQSQKLTLWIQLTLSKLCVVILGKLTPNVDYENFKIQLEAEEIVSSLDIQDVYSKIKMKLTSLNVNCFLKLPGVTDWQAAPYEGKVLFCNNMMSKSLKSKTASGNGNLGHIKLDNQPFLVFAYTQALHSNVKEKLSADTKQRVKSPTEGMKYISEIDLKMKSFGAILWMSLFDVLHQVSHPFLSMLSPSSPCSVSEGKQLKGAMFCAKNLPLFYIETNIIQIYLPENASLTEYLLREDSANVLEDATVLLTQLDCITLTSQVENPLPRIILNSDIYNNALNSKTIGLPGAAVEDRQYQMDVSGLSLGTISGPNILGQNELKKDFISHYPLTMGENPALEWNIGVIPENRSVEKDSVVITPIISPLNIRIAIAPAIVCDSSSQSLESEKIVVAGISSEISVTSEVCLYLSIHEMCALHSLLQNNLNILNETFSYPEASLQTNASSPVDKNCSYGSNISLARKFAPDSSLHANLSMSDEASNCNWIPFEMLLTAGTVSVMLFYHDHCAQPTKESVKVSKSTETFSGSKDNLSQSPHDFDSGPPNYSISGNNHGKGTFSSSKAANLHPFLCLSIIQPHSYLLCHPSSQKFESSCFDLQLHGAFLDQVLKKPNKSCTPIKDDFNNPYLETKPGEPHQKTGIPPAFFTVTCTDIFSEPANIKISVERPVKLNLRIEMGDAVLAFLVAFQKEFLKSNSPAPELTAESSGGSKVLTYFKTMTLSTSQVVLQFTPLVNDPTEKLVLSATSMKIKTDIETCNEAFKSLDLNLDISSFLVQTSDSNQMWNFLQPLSFSAEIKFHLLPCVQFEFGVTGESLILNFSLHHILHLKKLIEVIAIQFQKSIASITDITKSFKQVNTKLDPLPGFKDNKKRKYWSDDLRKGSFQFLQVTESSDCQPRPHEILFGRASANQPASMTWRYPEPRAVTKIEVSPVPFQNSDHESNKNVITCYLQYWNSSHREYSNLCDFALSETKHFSFDLPDVTSDSVAVSDKWRVLLDSGSYLDEDGALEKENPDLSPLALAACMSIDSCFDPKLVPVLQSKLSFDLVKLIFYNSFGTPGCSPNLFPFEFDDESPLIQEFALLSFLNPTCSFIQKTSRMKGELSSGITCEILEYRNLTMLPVISPVDILAKATANFEKENVPIFDMEVVLQPCFVRLSQSLFHTLTYTIHSISQEMSNSFSTSECCEYVLPNYYIICNNLEERIRFGQAGTEESIILSPLKMHAYSWWCQKTKQTLWMSVGSLGWKWSDEIDIDGEGTRTVALDNNIVAIIKIKQLSNLQKQVIIDGQLIVHSQLSFPIQLRCEFPVSTPTKTNARNLLFNKSLAPQFSSPSFLLSAEQCKSMCLSVTGILDSQWTSMKSAQWSENISLGDNKLLKIPWKDNNVFQSVWCQVVEQKIFNITTVVVFISPLFVLRSNLPLSLKVNISSEDQEEIYSLDLKGRGQEVKLFKGSDAESYLLLSFKSNTDIDMSIPALSVSLTDRNQVKMKGFDPSIDLFEKFNSMQSINNKLWPYSFLERPSKPGNYLHPCFEENHAVVPAVPSNNVCCKLKIERSQRWIGLNTILYDIKPHVIVVNRLRADLYLFDKNGLEWMLPPNSVAMPSHPYESFRLTILEDKEYFYSSELTVDEKCVTKGTLNREDSEAAFFCTDRVLRIPQNGSINIFIKVQTDRQKVFLFKLHSEVQEDVVVITAFPLVTLSNETNKNLHFSLSCTPSNALNVTYPDSCPSPVIHSDSTKECQPLLFWEASSFDVSSLTTSTSLTFYVSICFPSCQLWSFPVCLRPSASTELNNDGRHTISVPANPGDKSASTVPLVVTSHWRNGMLYLLLNTDPCPLVLLNNRTSMDIFYGQSCLDMEGKTEGKFIFEELQNHSAIPVLLPENSAHYSFPYLQNQFPLVPKKPPMLCLGLKEEGSQNCIWSAPFKVNIDKQFIHILGICDFMVCSERVKHTINLYIDPVNRIEVTANEVRSRIAQATNTNSHNEKKSSLTFKPHKKSAEPKVKNRSASIPKQSQISNPPVALRNIYFVNLRVIHVSFIICDEFQDVNKSTEVLRLNINNIILFSRPQSENLSKLQDISLCFQNVQLDNQMDNGSIVYDFPVVLNRQEDAKKQPQSDKDNDVYLPNKIRENSMFILNAAIELNEERSRSIIVQSLSVDLLPVSLHVEDTFCYKVLSLLKTYVPFQFHQHEGKWVDIYVPKNVKYVSDAYMYPAHFQNFKFNVQEISLSLHASLKLYLSLEHSLLRFQPFEREDILTSHYEIGRMLVVHYFTGALFRAGWVVGSLDLLGNPAGFARAVGAGMSDLVYLPYKGMLHGPRAFISGLTTGAISLFTQVSSGALTCMASMTSSISKNMDFLCLDNEHLARQELVRQHLPQGISEGLTQGLSVFGLSILGAVAGIVDHPLQALVSPSTPMQTVSGIVGGLGKGIVGVFTKPIGGAAELLSQAGYGLLHGAGWLIPPKRQYQPVTMSLAMTSSSLIKYLCKVALCQSLGQVLLALEATYVNENGEYEKNILLLTSEALCILAEDEVTLQRTFALTEIQCKKAESDRSTLVIIPSSTFHKQIFPESSDVLDRVAEYVKKNRENSTASDGSPFSPENVPESLIKSSSTYHIFFLYPKDRSLFISLFDYAKSKALRKGF